MLQSWVKPVQCSQACGSTCYHKLIKIACMLVETDGVITSAQSAAMPTAGHAGSEACAAQETHECMLHLLGGRAFRYISDSSSCTPVCSSKVTRLHCLRRSLPYPELGEDWTRVKHVRPNGRTVWIFYSPGGRTFRSKKCDASLPPRNSHHMNRRLQELSPCLRSLYEYCFAVMKSPPCTSLDESFAALTAWRLQDLSS